MFNNLVSNDSDLLINVGGCKHKQNITTADLIRNCKMKNKILNRPRRDNNPDTIFEPQETVLDLKMKGYHGQGREKRTPKTMDSGGNFHQQMPESSSKGLKVNRMVVPAYAKK